MRTAYPKLVAAAVVAALSAAMAPPAAALPTPSKTSPDQTLAERQLALAEIEAVVAGPEIAAALARHGFSTDDVHQRLAQLSPEEIQTVSQQLDLLQAAGSGVPNYIWILLGILLGVLIISAF